MHTSVRIYYRDRQGANQQVEAVECPRCEGVILVHSTPTTKERGDSLYSLPTNEFILFPRTSGRKALPPEVPEPYAGLYREAALIVGDSPRASAALSRRCLQHLLREEAHAPKGDLYNEIEWTINNAQLPHYCTDSLHELREIGNMAAHPNKSSATGDYMEVEPGEAEWTLDTLDALFGFYFIEPAKTAARKAALSAKTGR
jgi:hypothetical protein